MKKLLMIVFTFILLASIVISVDDLISLQANVNLDGNPAASGDVLVTIYDHPTAGNLVYNSTTDFNEKLVNGRYDILLGNGSNELSLEYGKAYYFDIEINRNDLDFDGQERQLFMSSVGIIGAEDFNSSVSNLFVNITGDTIIGNLSINRNINLTSEGSIDVQQDITIKRNFFINNLFNITGSTGELRGLGDWYIGTLFNISASTGNLRTSGNISANFYFGDGRYITGITQSRGNTSEEMIQAVTNNVNSTSWIRSLARVFLQNIGDFVGIGTDSPNEALTVVGNANITGVIYGNGSQLTDISDTICSTDEVLLGNGSCKSSAVFFDDTNLITFDSNASTECDADEVLLGNGSCKSSATFFDDTNLITFDSNASTECDADEVLLGNGSCQSSLLYTNYVNTTAQFLTIINNVVNSSAFSRIDGLVFNTDKNRDNFSFGNSSHTFISVASEKGYVGIGTPNPANKLQVHGNIYLSLADSTIFFQGGGGQQRQSISYSGSHENLRFSANGATYIVLDSGGEFGVGETATNPSPLGKFYVIPSSAGQIVSVIKGGTAQSGDLFQIRSFNSSGTKADLFTVDRLGLVAIGNVTPNEKLTVVGNVNITGFVNANSFIGNGFSLTNVNATYIKCGSDEVLLGNTSCKSVSVFFDDTNLITFDSNASTECDNDEVLLGNGSCKSSAFFFDDTNLITFDSNASTECDLDEVLLGNGSCKSSLLYTNYVNTTDQFLAIINNAVNSSSWVRSLTNVFLQNILDKVGIGTSQPNEALTVVGNANITGNIYGTFIGDGSQLTDISDTICSTDEVLLGNGSCKSSSAFFDDTNLITFDSNATTECDADEVLLGNGSCKSSATFFDDTNLITFDSNASTECDADEVLLGNGSCKSSSVFFDDTNLITFDSNATTECDSDEVLLGNGSCQSSLLYTNYVNTTAQFLAIINSAVNSSLWVRSLTNVFLQNIGDFVGIGTSQPNEALTVVGNANITGNIYGVFVGDGSGLTGIAFVNQPCNATYACEVVVQGGGFGSGSGVTLSGGWGLFDNGIIIKDNSTYLVTAGTLNGSQYPALDNVFAIGNSTHRYSEIYATTFRGDGSQLTGVLTTLNTSAELIAAVTGFVNSTSFNRIDGLIYSANPGDNVNISGDITATYYFGDGRYLTGITSSGGNSSAEIILATNNNVNSSSWIRSLTNVFLQNALDKVGIGTNSPNEKLTVIGNANITGNIYGTFIGDGSQLTDISDIICSNDEVLLGNGSCKSSSVFFDNTNLITFDSNASTECDLDEVLLGNGSCKSSSVFFDDTNLITFDSNASTECDLDEVLLGNGSCKSSLLYTNYVNTTAQFLTIINNAVNSSSWARSLTYVFLQNVLDKVGIGTNQPNEALTVVGNVNITNNVSAQYYRGSGRYLTDISDTICSNADEVLLQNGSCISTSVFFDDTNLITFDSNASTECDLDEVLLGNGSCKSSTTFFDDTDTTNTSAEMILATTGNVNSTAFSRVPGLIYQTDLGDDVNFSNNLNISKNLYVSQNIHLSKLLSSSIIWGGTGPSISNAADNRFTINTRSGTFMDAADDAFALGRSSSRDMYYSGSGGFGVGAGTIGATTPKTYTYTGLKWSTPQTVDSTLFYIDNISRSLIFTDVANRLTDHNHTAQDNPTIFLHSATNPKNEVDQWISLAHDTVNGLFKTGEGGFRFEPNNSLSTFVGDINSTGFYYGDGSQLTDISNTICSDDEVLLGNGSCKSSAVFFDDTNLITFDSNASTECDLDEVLLGNGSCKSSLLYTNYVNTTAQFLMIINNAVNSSSWVRSATNIFLQNIDDNVGIGTINPNEKLTVIGNANITNNVSAQYYRGDGRYLTGIASSPGNTSAEMIQATTGQVNSTAWSKSGTNVFLQTLTDRVGIGTATPTARLDVNGNASFGQSAVNDRATFNHAVFNRVGSPTGTGVDNDTQSGTIYVDDNNVIFASSQDENSGAAGGFIFQLDNDGTAVPNFIIENRTGEDLHVFTGDGSYGLGDSSPEFSIEIAKADTSGYFGVGTASGNGEYLSVDLDGQVGIGTNAPEFPLHIGGSVSGTNTAFALDQNEWFNFGHTSGRGFICWFCEANGTSILNTHSTIPAVRIAQTSHALAIQTSTILGDGNVPSFINTLYVNSSGDIGIGTSTPSSKLQVAGTVTATSFIGDGSQLTGISFIDTNATTECDLDEVLLGNGSCKSSAIFFDNTDISGGNTSAEMILATTGNVNSTSWIKSGTNVFLQTLTDKVGIGINNPTSTLHVNGTINLSNTYIHSVQGLSFMSIGTSPTIAASLSVARGAAGSLGNIELTDSSEQYYIGTDGGHFILRDDEDSVITTPARLMIQDSTGRVGIQDSSPDFKTEIVGSSGNGYFGVTLFDVEGEGADGGIFTINSNGSVGIGTSSPNEALTVVGNTNITKNLSVGSNFVVNEKSKIVQIGSTLGLPSGTQTLTIEGPVNSRALRLEEGGADTEAMDLGVDISGNFNIWDDILSTPLLFIQDNTGFIGINTTSPTQKLDVRGAAIIDDALTITGRAGTEGGEIRLSHPGRTDEIKAWYIDADAGNDFRIHTNGNVRFMIDNITGYVGIHAVSPTAKLTIEDATNVPTTPVVSSAVPFAIKDGASTAMLFDANQIESVGSDLNLNVRGTNGGEPYRVIMTVPHMIPRTSPPAIAAQGTMYTDNSGALCWHSGSAWVKIGGTGTCA